ncbi:hypothetical protein Mudajogi_00002 [Pseudomonas phage vB_PpuP-Mudajogi]|uniref:Uncharacterized protein n=1 Tax=Pseudomonas phage vB_PpuP-Mudajogi TaxID=3132683 RepID=A0AAX4NBU0_9CAUD
MNHHYFGSTCFNWATGATRQEVVTKLAKMAGTEQLKRSVKGSGGLYCWTCKVGVPEGTDYQISYFQPQGVPVTDGQNHNIMNVKGHVTLIEPKEVE